LFSLLLFRSIVIATTKNPAFHFGSRVCLKYGRDNLPASVSSCVFDAIAANQHEEIGWTTTDDQGHKTPRHRPIQLWSQNSHFSILSNFYTPPIFTSMTFCSKRPNREIGLRHLGLDKYGETRSQ